MTSVHSDSLHKRKHEQNKITFVSLITLKSLLVLSVGVVALGLVGLYVFIKEAQDLFKLY